MKYNIAEIRHDFIKRKLKPELLDKNPIKQFEQWLEEAISSAAAEPTAFCLGTASQSGKPTSRMLLLKGIDENGFQFFTNYRSEKSRNLDENPHCTLTFYWPELERQVNIYGKASRTSKKISDDYFATRPWKSQIGAWISPQSEPIGSRNFIKVEFAKYAAKFVGKKIPRPDYWGGFQVNPDTISFWQGRASRLHDRVKYTLQPDNSWKKERIAP